MPQAGGLNVGLYKGIKGVWSSDKLAHGAELSVGLQLMLSQGVGICDHVQNIPSLSRLIGYIWVFHES